MTEFDFVQVVQFWDQIGVFNVILPFILVFTIAFAILDKSKILGEKKPINVVISLILGLLFIANPTLVGTLVSFLPNVSMFMVVVVMFLLLIGIFGGGSKWRNGMLGFAAVVSFIFVIWSLVADNIATNLSLPLWLTDMSPGAKQTIIFLGILVILIWLVTREKKQPGKGKGIGDFLKAIGENIEETKNN